MHTPVPLSHTTGGLFMGAGATGDRGGASKDPEKCARRAKDLAGKGGGLKQRTFRATKVIT